MKKLLMCLLFVPLLYSFVIAGSLTDEFQLGEVKSITGRSPRKTSPKVSTSTSPYADTNNDKEMGWKTSDHFELSYIEGYQEIYNPEEQIAFYVEGKSDKMNVDPENGFIAGAVIYESSKKIMDKQTFGKYDYDRRAWLVVIDAPKDNTNRYEMFIALTCSKNDSECANIYGSGTQQDRVLPLQLR